MKVMGSLRQAGIVVLLLVSYLTPAMACMVSKVQMNAEERACCQAMKNQCEQMEMPASHDCCQKAPQSALYNALETKTVTYHPIAVAVICLPAEEWLNPNLLSAELVEHADYSPPQSPPPSISVLKI